MLGLPVLGYASLGCFPEAFCFIAGGVLDPWELGTWRHVVGGVGAGGCEVGNTGNTTTGSEVTCVTLRTEGTAEGTRNVLLRLLYICGMLRSSRIESTIMVYMRRIFEKGALY